MELIAEVRGREERVRVERTAAGFAVTVGDRRYAVDAVATGGHVYSLLLDGVQHEVSVRPLGDGRYAVAGRSRPVEVELLDPLTHMARETRAGGGAHARLRVAAYMPGRVVAVLVGPGDRVEAGQGIVVLEAMKMENEIQAEHAGVVRKILVETGQAVEGGDALFELEST